MQSSTVAITALNSLPALEGHQLLKILLRSIPSAQHRPELEVAQNDEDMIDQLLARRPSRESFPSSSEAQDSAYVPAESATTPVGLLRKVRELFGMLSGSTVKVEEESTQLDVKKESDEPAHFLQIQAASKTGAIQAHENTDEDDEMEVEYMIVAEKCFTAATSVVVTHDKMLERQRRSKRRVGEVPSRFLTAPPIIKRRRQIARLHKPKRKLKGVPGFR